MSENDPTFTTAPDVPDPVVDTEPAAEPAPDANTEEDVDAMLAGERPIVLPPAGPQTGVAVPPLK